MQSITHSGRVMSLSTPLGPDVLLLERLDGHEAISEPFVFKLNLLAENGTEIPFEQLLGQAVSVELRYPGRPQRFVNGIVRSFSQTGRGEVFTTYEAEVVPNFWRLTRRIQSRIFQRSTVIDILKEVLQGIDVAYRLSSDYRRHEYCVQYCESDFDFASRMMEEEGLHYYFAFSADGHQMIISDNSRMAPSLPVQGSVRYDEARGGYREQGRVSQWKKHQVIRSSSYALRDYTHEAPADLLEASHLALADVQVGTQKHYLSGIGNSDLFVQQYPGGYAHRFDSIAGGGGHQPESFSQLFRYKDQVARLRMEEEDAQSIRVEGESDLHHFTPGYAFQFNGHFNGDGDYLACEVRHAAVNTPFRSEDDERKAVYSNTFVGTPAELPYRPVRRTPRPRIQGTQTATVVGPQGETIFTDPVGRVKVQFHWDRQHQFNADSSCWVRVSQGWAGKGFGFSAIPRIGHEVLVDFLEGDPDCPVVVGSLYNSTNMPPQLLPGKKNQTQFKSQSVSHSAHDPVSSGECHGMVLDDTKGSELLHFHSELTRSDSTEGDHYVSAGGSHQTNVGSFSLYQVGGKQGSDHAKGPTSVNGASRPTYTQSMRGVRGVAPQSTVAAAPPSSGNGSGSGGGDDADMTGEASGEWGTKMEFTLGLFSGTTIGNHVEFSVGTSTEFTLNPSGLISVFVSNPIAGFVVQTLEGFAQSYATGAIANSNPSASPSAQWAQSTGQSYAMTIPGIANKAYRSAVKLQSKSDKERNENASKKYPKDYDNGKEKQENVNKTQKELKEAQESKNSLDEQRKAVEGRQKDLQSRKTKSPNDKDIDDKLKDTNDQLKEIDDKLHGTGSAKGANDKLKEAQDNFDKASKEQQDSKKSYDDAADKARSNVEQQKTKLKTLNGEKEKAYKQYHSDKSDYEESKSATDEAKAEWDKDPSNQSLENKYNSAKSKSDAALTRMQDSDKKANDKFQECEDQKKAIEESKSKAEEAEDQKRSAEKGADDASDESEGEEEHETEPETGDFLGAGQGTNEICIGTWTEILYGPKFDIHRGPSLTEISTPFQQTPEVCKGMMLFYSAYEVATSVVQALNPDNLSSADEAAMANVYEVSLPLLMLQIWVAIEYTYPTAVSAGATATTATNTTASTTANPTFMAAPATYIAKMLMPNGFKWETTGAWIFDILMTAATVIPTCVEVSKSGSGSGADGWEPSDLNSGSGGSGSLTSVEVDVEPKVLDCCNGYVINANNVQLNTMYNPETLGPSVISLNALGTLEEPGLVNIYATGTTVVQGGVMALIKVETCADIGAVSISCGEDGAIMLGNGNVPTNSLLINAEGNTLTAGENVMTHDEDGFFFEVADTEVALTEEGVEITCGGSSISMSDDSITLEAGGAMISISSAGIVMEGPVVEMTAEGDVNIDGSCVSIEGDDCTIDCAALEIDAAMVSLL